MAYEEIVTTSDSRLSDARPANGGNSDTVDGKHASDFATSGHSHGLNHSDLTQYVNTDNETWAGSGITNNGFVLKSIRTQMMSPSWLLPNYSAGIVFGGADSKGVISQRYDWAEVRFGGGAGDRVNWTFSITAASGARYSLDGFPNILTRGLNPEGFSYEIAEDGGIYNIKLTAYGSTDEYNVYCVNNLVYVGRVGNGGWETLFSASISVSGNVLNFGFKGWTSYVITKFVNWNAG